MKYLSILALLIAVNSHAQQWKTYIIGVRGDTLNRVDMNGKKQGPWVVHVDELRGEPGYDEQGYYENDQKVDKWVRFSLQGDKIAEENYRFGFLNGKNKYYTRTGGLLREETWRAVEPGKSFDTVDVKDPNDPSKVIDRVVVKVDGTTFRHGTWTYYDPEWGTIQKTEEWWMNKLKTGDGIPGDSDDELKPIDPRKKATAKTDKDEKEKEVQKPAAILDYEKKNKGKKIKVRDGRTGG
ncbi:MAG: hypothetical protein DI535_18640 [Citrobacter freundii]|nr:MAG: hypothetical protein DI535_18640 [Citrobacter freundii]